MTSKPFSGLLDYDLSLSTKEKKRYKDVLDEMTELVHYSTNLFARCSQSFENSDLSAFIVFFNFRNAIELADAIRSLSENCITVPSSILIRSMFETLLNIEYILESDIHYNKRAMSYLYYSRLNDKKVTQLMLDAKIKNDPDSIINFLSIKLDKEINLNNLLDRNNELLSKTYLKEITDCPKYKITKNGKKIILRNWFSLFKSLSGILCKSEKLVILLFTLYTGYLDEYEDYPGAYRPAS